MSDFEREGQPHGKFSFEEPCRICFEDRERGKLIEDFVLKSDGTDRPAKQHSDAPSRSLKNIPFILFYIIFICMLSPH